MNIKIYDGRTQFYQYDVNQKLIIEDIENVTHLHFATDTLDSAIVQPIYTSGDQKLCDVPNIMLAQRNTLYVYACIDTDDADSTVDMFTFNIVNRHKPSDYVAPNEILTWTALHDEISKLKEEIANQSGLTDEAKTALLNCLKNVAWAVPNGQDYYNALETALNSSGEDTPIIPPDEPTILTYTITNTLTNVTNDNANTSIEENDSYVANLTPIDGYTLGGVTVIMGGTDVTSTVYSDGVINISNVIGDIVIEATGVVEVVTETWESGVDYDLTDKLLEGVELNQSDGTEIQNETYTTTDYLYCAGADYIHYGTSASTIYFYDVNKNFISNYYLNSEPGTAQVPTNAVYFRLSVKTQYFTNRTITPIAKAENNSTLGEQVVTWESGEFDAITVEEVAASSKKCTVEYIPIVGANTVTFGSSVSQVALYDENKNGIAVARNKTNLDLTKLPFSGYSYMRLSVFSSSTSTLTITLS